MHHGQAVVEGSTLRGQQRKLQSERTDNRAASIQTSPDSDTSAVVPLRNQTVRPLLLPRIDRAPDLAIHRTASEPVGGNPRAQLSLTHSCLNQRRSAAPPSQVTKEQQLTCEQRTNVSKVANFSLASSALRVAANWAPDARTQPTPPTRRKGGGGRGRGAISKTDPMISRTRFFVAGKGSGEQKPLGPNVGTDEGSGGLSWLSMAGNRADSPRKLSSTFLPGSVTAEALAQEHAAAIAGGRGWLGRRLRSAPAAAVSPCHEHSKNADSRKGTCASPAAGEPGAEDLYISARRMVTGDTRPNADGPGFKDYQGEMGFETCTSSDTNAVTGANAACNATASAECEQAETNAEFMGAVLTGSEEDAAGRLDCETEGPRRSVDTDGGDENRLNKAWKAKMGWSRVLQGNGDVREALRALTKCPMASQRCSVAEARELGFRFCCRQTSRLPVSRLTNALEVTVCNSTPIADDDLVFISNFEGGNLFSAQRVAPMEYDLQLQVDKGCDAEKLWTQWFYFIVANATPGESYRFNIINFSKSESLFGKGQQPLMFSKVAHTDSCQGWQRIGRNIQYFRNGRKRHGKALYTLSFTVDFAHARDVCLFAYCFPYSYAQLQEDLEEISNSPVSRAHCSVAPLCLTATGTECKVLTITANEGSRARASSQARPGSARNASRKAVFLSARVHPGESNSSWMMRGLIDFLAGPSSEAQRLRRIFVFKIIPMLNPDGVIHGQYRANMTGSDLNRQWATPSAEEHPTIWHAKALIQRLQTDCQVVMFCDLHGHSVKHNLFLYGCPMPTAYRIAAHANAAVPDTYPEFAEMLQLSSPTFSLSDSKLHVLEKGKENTGRVVAWRQLGIRHSFTLEASLCGTNMCTAADVSGNTGALVQYACLDFEQMGHDLGIALALWSSFSARDRFAAAARLALPLGTPGGTQHTQRHTQSGHEPGKPPETTTSAGVKEKSTLPHTGGYGVGGVARGEATVTRKFLMEAAAASAGVDVEQIESSVDFSHLLRACSKLSMARDSLEGPAFASTSVHK